jgi:predicted DNA-binding protein with PD1-like motif
MVFGKLDERTYLIRLSRGEDVHEKIKTFCKEQGITNALVSALGSLENPTLAHYRMDNKKYSEKKLEGIFELTNLTGNIGILDDDLILHFHVTIANEEMQAFGGHLVQGNASATLELTLTVYPTTFEKKMDEEVGLKLWQLPEQTQDL